MAKANGSTDNLWNHYNRHHTKGNIIVPSNAFNVSEYTDMLVKWIVTNMHAFSIVDEDDFRESAIYLNPNCKIVCAKTIRNKIAGKFNEFKLKIIDYFKTCECKFYP